MREGPKSIYPDRVMEQLNLAKCSATAWYNEARMFRENDDLTEEEKDVVGIILLIQQAMEITTPTAASWPMADDGTEKVIDLWCYKKSL